MEKHVTLKPRHGCSPLWVYSGPELVDNPEPDELPVTAELRAALTCWSATYQGTLDLEHPHDSGFATPDEAAAFEAEGLRLARSLQEQLGPDFVVSYQRLRDARGPETRPEFATAHSGGLVAGSVTAGARDRA